MTDGQDGETEDVKGLMVTQPMKSASPPGPPSLNWSEEGLNAADQKMLTQAPPSDRAWVPPDVRSQSLKSASDGIFFVVQSFFRRELTKLRDIFSRQPKLEGKKWEKAINKAMQEYDWTPWRDVLRPQVMRQVEDAFEQGAQDVWQVLRQKGINLSWGTVSSYARNYGMQRSAELVGMSVDEEGKLIPSKHPKMRIDEDTRRNLQEWLKNELKSGKDWVNIADDLYSQSGEIGFPFMSDWRARRIARTEASMSYSRGQIASARDADVTKVEVLDGTQDEICAPVNHQIWSLEEAESNPVGHPNCLIPGTIVSTDGVQASFSRRYVGPVIVIRTASNHELTVTPNHPILTTNGWVPASEIREGDEVICDLGFDRPTGGPDNDNMVAPIEHIADSLPVVLSVVPVTSEDFHGDGGSDDEVCIIRSNSLLTDCLYSSISEEEAQSILLGTNVSGVRRIRSRFFNSFGTIKFIFHCLFATTNRVVSGFGNRLGIILPPSFSTEKSGFATGTVNAGFSNPISDSRSADAKLIPNLVTGHSVDEKLNNFISGNKATFIDPSRSFHGEPIFSKSGVDNTNRASTAGRNSLNRLSRRVSPVKVVYVGKREFSGQVYNLHTDSNVYVANSIITHNCSRQFLFVIE